MKKKISNLFYVIVIICFIGCQQGEVYEYKQYPFTMVVQNGTGTFGTYFSDIKCDSFQFISTKKAYAWVNGTKLMIIAEQNIKVHSNKIKIK